MALRTASTVREGIKRDKKMERRPLMTRRIRMIPMPRDNRKLLR